jgi:hypothetical protein
MKRLPLLFTLFVFAFASPLLAQADGYLTIDGAHAGLISVANYPPWDMVSLVDLEDGFAPIAGQMNVPGKAEKYVNGVICVLVEAGGHSFGLYLVGDLPDLKEQVTVTFWPVMRPSGKTGMVLTVWD